MNRSIWWGCLCLALVCGQVSAFPEDSDKDDSELSRAERHNNLGTQHASRGDFRQAAGAFRKAIALDATMTVAHYNLGLALSRVKSHMDAVFAFQSALRLSPRYFDAWFQLGLALMSLENFGEAATAFEECLSLRPRDPAARFRLGQSYWKASQWDRAVEAWVSLLNDSPGHPSAELVHKELPRAYYNLGLNHQVRGATEEARAAYREALRLNASDVSSLNNLAVLERKAGRLDEASRLFRDVLDTWPEHVDARLGLGEILLAMYQPREASDTYRELLSTRAGDERVYRGLALSHLKIGEVDSAMGWVAQAQKRTSDYEGLLLKAFILEHNAAGERYGKGYAESAVQQTYSDVIKKYPDKPVAHYNLGIVHARANRWSDAVASFDRVLAIDSTYTAARVALDEVDRITKSQNIQILRIKRP